MQRAIRLRGVRVHNLRGIDLDIPLRKLIVVTGVSGSGKSSLAFDTLYAEGQRRYIETFSAYTRQFLERLDKPDAESIDNIPPAIAIGQKAPTRSSRSTVGTVTEIHDYLRLLYAKIGRVVCSGCGREVSRDSARTVAQAVAKLPAGARFMVTYPCWPSADANLDELAAALKEDGFVRAVVGGREINLNNHLLPRPPQAEPILVVVDRLTAGQTTPERLAESAETAFQKGDGRCWLLVEGGQQSAAKPEPDGGEAYASAAAQPLDTPGSATPEPPAAEPSTFNLQPSTLRFNERLRCDECNLDYPEPEPRQFSFNNPMGACPRCEGFGNIIDVDLDLVVPDKSKSLREGAIAPWNTPAYVHELEELLDLAPDYGLPVDVPFRDLNASHRKLIVEGVPAREFGGLRGFFAWLERKKYKMHVRVFLSRWRSYRTCPECNGARLKPLALCVRVGRQNIAELSALKIQDALVFVRSLSLSQFERQVTKLMLEQITSRLAYLEAVGLGYLTLDRLTRTLSGGEARRVTLTTALGSSLVNTLYVLDEPSIGLHPRDTARLVEALLRLRDRGNTVVVVEHDESIIRAADQIIDIGPGAGQSGGRVVFQGTPAEIVQTSDSATGEFLSGRRRITAPQRRRIPDHGWIRLRGAREHNLKSVDVEFPLGVLCVVTGVSGSGKSTLVQDTLYPALCRRLRKETIAAGAYDDVMGDGQIDDVVLVDQSPIGRTPRSNPVTYIKAFDEIRRAFASTLEARLRNYGPRHFSFNVESGRCEACQGNGYVAVDMQFLADVFMRCSECGGKRFRPEVLEVKFRGKTIADCLELTVREAFAFFRQHEKVQARLKMLIDVGLDYLRLGQPANTLSGGEAQRLKLAGYMSATKRNRCLFLLDEPTTGLHFADILQLLDCFNALVTIGHSLIVVEHNLEVIKSADYIIDLGPGAADEGGRIVAQGNPEQVGRVAESQTGRFLKTALAQAARVGRTA